MTSRPNVRSLILGCLTAAMVLSLAAAPALAQQLGGAKPIEVPVIQLVAGLILCSLAAFAIALLMKKRSQGGGAPLLPLLKWRNQAKLASAGVRVLETHRLSVHADLCRFTSANREYLVILSSGAVTVLRDQPVAIEPTSGPAGGAS